MINNSSLVNKIVEGVAKESPQTADKTVRYDAKVNYVKSYKSGEPYARITKILAYLGYTKSEATTSYGFTEFKATPNHRPLFIPRIVQNHIKELEREIDKLQEKIDKLEGKTPKSELQKMDIKEFLDTLGKDHTKQLNDGKARKQKDKEND